MLVVLGNACRDTTYRVCALPRPGETVVAQGIDHDLGGKGLNQAIMARRAGAVVRLVAAVGSDESARLIRNQLRAEGIDDSDLVACDGDSDSSLILLDDTGENVIISDTRQAEGLPPEQTGPLLGLGPRDGLLLQGNLSRRTTEAAILLGNAARATVILNAAPLRPWFAQFAGHIDVLIANQLEATECAGINSSLLAITRGAEGCVIRRPGHPDHMIPAPRVNVRDTTGAGDTFAGVFAAGLLAHGDPLSAALFGVHAASDKVTRDGTVRALPTEEWPM